MLMTYSSQVSSLRLIVEFKQEMARKFEMSDLGKLTYYLGIEVRQTDEGIVLSQDRYAHKIFEEAGMHKCNLTHIPMDMNMRLSKSPRETSIDEREYKRSIGCLQYQLVLVCLVDICKNLRIPTEQI